MLEAAYYIKYMCRECQQRNWRASVTNFPKLISRQRLEAVVFFLLVFFLPSQLAIHFWPSWALVNNIRVDYLAPTVYLTDFLIVALLFFNPPRVKVPLFIIVFVVLNIFFSFNPLLSLYKYLRLLEYFFFFKYLIKRPLTINLVFPLSLSIIWTSFLAWFQFAKQSSIGGMWYWLGERTFNVITPGIAKISLFGHLLLRPYATLPHPNALAGFLLVAGLIIYFLNKKSLISNLSFLIALITFPLTFSRTAIFLETGILVFLFRSKMLKLLILIFSLISLISVSGSMTSISDRLVLVQKSLIIISKAPLLGVGLGNFIPATMVYQPVHNIYLLTASELGLPAAIIIFYWLIKRFGHPALFVVLIIGLIDHYWFTLHQNVLLLVILMAVIYESFTPDRQEY